MTAPITSWSHFAWYLCLCFWICCLTPVSGLHFVGLSASGFSVSPGSSVAVDPDFVSSSCFPEVCSPWTELCRLGEACNPGPDLEDSSDGFRIQLGTANTAGLANKVPLLSSLDAGIWGLTETHLTLDGFKAVRSTLKLLGRQQGRNLRFVAGAPAPARSLNSRSGTWTGVAVASDFPCHAFNAQWPSLTFETGRIQAVTSYVGQTPIVMATVYGAAQSPTFRDPLAITEELLNQVTAQIVDHGVGPRCIVGDFNCDLMQFPVMHHWYTQGWRELQVHSTALHGTVCSATCKNATIRDFVWCSPELLRFWCCTSITPNLFPDHAVVGGSFWIPAFKPDTWYWPQPQPIPWNLVRIADWHACLEDVWTPFSWTSDPSASFACWSAQVEKSIGPFVTAPTGKLPSGSLGRGQTRQARKGHPVLHTVKPSRPGELPMPLSFPDLLLHRWYKQLRRLQSLLHSCRRGSCGVDAATYQAQCWSSIIRAPGFKPNFRAWWPSRQVRLQASPSALVGLPTLEQLEHVFLDFQLDRLDSWYRQKRFQLTKLRRESHSKDMYKALRPDGPEPLDFLTVTSHFSVEAVHPPSGAVRLDAVPVSFDGIWTFSGESITPVPSPDPDSGLSRAWCQFESDILPVPGHQLTAVRPVTDVPAIHKTLLDFWLPRWQSLGSVPPDAWDRITQFTQAYIPPGHLAVPDFGLQDYRAAFRQKSALRTGGLDGWHKMDIISLPDCLLADMVALHRRVEQGAAWPDQILRGHVFCLQKSPNLFEAANFRPIVLFSLWYRLWSSLQARHYLCQLEQMAQFPAFGFLTGRGCQDLTYAVQSSLEVALAARDDLCGGLFDIEKCFNFIPRAPVFFLAKWFGLDDTVLHGWSSFLSGMCRSFMVHNQPSDAVCSDNGLPEGDSLSCVGMVLLDFSFHFYVRFFHPGINELSYVDNLELVARSMGDLFSGMATLGAWASMFRLRIDSKKSQLWSLSPHDRHALRVMGFSVVECTSDLGASMTYSARHLNRPLQSRILASYPLWHKLARLTLAPWHKLQAIRVALLPRALHACSNTCLGDTWFSKLRTLTMRALRFNRAGASPILRIAFVCGLDVDPGFYDAWQCWKDFLRFYQTNAAIRDSWETFWALQGDPLVRRTHGPFAKLLNLCSKLGWSLPDDATLDLGFGWRISLAWLDPGLGKDLLEHFWQQHLCAQFIHRKDMTGLLGINVSASFFEMKGLDVAQSELLNCIRDGTFHLCYHKAKIDPEVTIFCPCGQGEDTLEHRALCCRLFARPRLQHLDVVHLWYMLPDSMTHHGLAPANPWKIPLWKSLSDSSWDAPLWHGGSPPSGTQMLYTDGSCTDQQTADVLIGGWCLVSANLKCTVGSGIVPSHYHTSDRSEVWAFAMALRWLIHWKCSNAIIHTDSQYVHDCGLCLLKTGAVPSDWANQDLWHVVCQNLIEYQGCLQLRKVAAHCVLRADMSFDEQEHVRWNELADTNAKIARLTGLSSFQNDLYLRYQRCQAWQTHWARRCQEFLLALAIHGLRGTDVLALTTEDLEDEFVFPEDPVTPNIGDLAEQFPIHLEAAISRNPGFCDFGIPTIVAIARWLVDQSLTASSVFPLTFLELFLGFHFEVGCVLPVQIRGRGGVVQWISSDSSSAGILLGRTLGSQISVFEGAVHQIFLDVVGSPLAVMKIRKPHLGIFIPCKAVHLPWSPRTASLVQSRLADIGRPFRYSRDFARAFP